MKVNANIYCVHSASFQSLVKDSPEFTQGGRRLLHNIKAVKTTFRARPLGAYNLTCAALTHKESRLENKSQEEKRQPTAGSANFAYISPTGELTMDDWVVREGNMSQLVLPVGARDHVQGSSEAIVTLLEYADFECERCAETFRVVNEITRWLRGELYYVFRHFPAANKHANALPAAEAAEAAGAQGCFWEMHDWLCEHSPTITDHHLKGYAQELGLDVERFERERRAHTHIEKVRKDFQSGVASGVIRTPAFFINGVRYRGEVDVDSLLAAIEEAGNRAICRREKRNV
jgi:protein-disulfide isomerase